MVTRVCGSVGRLNPTMHRGTNVPLKMMKIHILKLCRNANGVRCAPNITRDWPQRVRSVLHKSLQIWGWFLPKKIDLPTQGGGGRSGNFRGSKNQNSGKCHELSRKSIKKNLFTHPTPGGGGVGGQNFKSPVNFMNCRENR